MKNTWRILAAVAALSFTACPGDDEEGEGGVTGSCTGTITGSLTGTVRTCTVYAEKLATNGELIYTITVELASGSDIQNIDDVILTFSGDPQKGTFTGTAIRQVTGYVAGSSNTKQYEVQLGFNDDRGLATLIIDSVPRADDQGSVTYYEGFGGRAQIQYAPTPGTGSSGVVDLSLTFKP